MLDGGSIDRLKSNFDVGARSDYFHVDLILPSALRPENAGDNYKIPDMGIRVETCNLPASSVNTTNYSPYGNKTPRVTGLAYDTTTTLSFLCDSSFFDRIVLEAWHNLIFQSNNVKVESDGDMVFGPTQINPIYSYYDDYAKGSQIIIYQIRKDFRKSIDGKKYALKCTLHDAFPISYTAQSLSRVGTGDSNIMKFDVTFAFRAFDMDYADLPKSSLLNRGRKLLDALIQGTQTAGRYSSAFDRFSRKLSDFEDKANQFAGLFD